MKKRIPTSASASPSSSYTMCELEICRIHTANSHQKHKCNARKSLSALLRFTVFSPSPVCSSFFFFFYFYFHKYFGIECTSPPIVFVLLRSAVILFTITIYICSLQCKIELRMQTANTMRFDDHGSQIWWSPHISYTSNGSQIRLMGNRVHHRIPTAPTMLYLQIKWNNGVRRQTHHSHTHRDIPSNANAFAHFTRWMDKEFVRAGAIIKNVQTSLAQFKKAICLQIINNFHHKNAPHDVLVKCMCAMHFGVPFVGSKVQLAAAPPPDRIHCPFWGM